MGKIEVETLLATRPPDYDDYGLVTLKVHIPSYLWTELLTHKRLSRNASSARAQSPERHIKMGCYVPDVFYKQGKGMQAGEPVSMIAQWEAATIWGDAWMKAIEYVEALAALGVCKEQANRLLPPIKMVDGIVTATEDAWDRFLDLRLSPHADKAMQWFAILVMDAINQADWRSAYEHVPMADDDNDYMVAAARIARVSYSQKGGTTDDYDLAERLVANRHLSPFEHIAMWWEFPLPSAICSKITDTAPNGAGWTSYRASLEQQGI